MYAKTAEEYVIEILTALTKINPGSYIEKFDHHENSIDFITDGCLKRIIGIDFYIEPRLTLTITPILVTLKEIDAVRLNISLRARMRDFTTGRNEHVQNYDYFSESRWPIVGPTEKYWEKKIFRLNEEIKLMSFRLQRKYQPSKRLSAIVGTEPKPKYQILDEFSDYILKNKLRHSTGVINIDGLLKPFYQKGTICVSEGIIFETLQQNTLSTETQFKLLSFQQGIPHGMQKNSIRRSLANFKRSCNSSRYIERPTTEPSL
jgi:hypothetical protein